MSQSIRVYRSVSQSLIQPSCRSRSSIVASGRTSAYGTRLAARVLRGMTPHASSKRAIAAVNGLLTLASANGVAGFTARPVVRSALPLVTVTVRPSSQRMAAEIPANLLLRFSRHVLTRRSNCSRTSGSTGSELGRGTGRAAHPLQPPEAARVLGTLSPPVSRISASPAATPILKALIYCLIVKQRRHLCSSAATLASDDARDWRGGSMGISSR